MSTHDKEIILNTHLLQGLKALRQSARALLPSLCVGDYALPEAGLRFRSREAASIYFSRRCQWKLWEHHDHGRDERFGQPLL